MNIRRATPSDATAIAAIIVPIIREGTTYTLDPDMSELEALAYWMGHDKETFVAEQDGVVLGTYYMRPNQAGGGRHVCNCGYMTDAGGHRTWGRAAHVRTFAGIRAVAWLSGSAVQFCSQHQ